MTSPFDAGEMVELPPDSRAVLRDPARLAAVRATQLLDALVEPAFERLVQSAARLLDVSAAFISIVDAERDYYAAGHGLPEPIASTRELRGTSFCHLAIQSGTPLVIPDTAADPRYREMPTVRTMGVAAYVGVPLAFEKHHIGALCVVSGIARQWTTAEVDLLVELAASAEREVEFRVQARALAAERSLLRSVILSAPAPLALHLGPEHVFELINDQYRRIAGGRDVTGLPAREAFPALVGHQLFDVIDRVYTTGQPVSAPESHLRYDRDGTGLVDAWFDVHFEPIRNVDGSVNGVLNFSFDVSPQVMARTQAEMLLATTESTNIELQAKTQGLEVANRQLELQRLELEDRAAALALRTHEAEQATRRTEELQSLTAALAHAVTVDDVATVVCIEMADVLGARTSALAVRIPGTDTLELLSQRGIPQDVLARVQRQSLDSVSPRTRCFLSGAPVWLESRDGPDGLDQRFPPIAPVWDASGAESAAFMPLIAAGEPVGVISFSFPSPRIFGAADRAFFSALAQQAALAMERARLFTAERNARKASDAANRAKSDFLAVMSHELRTPLNAIGGYAELIELGVRGPVTDAQRVDLQRIQQSQLHLLELVNEVLDLAAVDAGELHVERNVVDTAAMIEAALALVRPQAAAGRLEVDTTCACEEQSCAGDGPRIRQVLVNVLANAVKFTPPGGRVTVSCGPARAPAGCDALHADASYLAIRIADTGIGISPRDMERIFEPFTQAISDGGPYARTSGGTGLGLTISRRLARLMQGELTAESTLGVGSTFTLWMPMALAATPPAA